MAASQVGKTIMLARFGVDHGVPLAISATQSALHSVYVESDWDFFALGIGGHNALSRFLVAVFMD